LSVRRGPISTFPTRICAAGPIPPGSRNTLIALARAWIAIDVDGYGVPSPLGEAAPR